MILNDEQRKKVLDNMGLVYHVMSKKLDIPPCDFEDVSQIGILGLMKATLSFDENKGTKFSTFASMCIRNEILMFYRKENKKRSFVISLDEEIFHVSENTESDVNTLAARLSDNTDFVQELVNREEFESRINLLLNVLPARELVLILLRLGEYPQKEISKCLRLSQSYVSRLESSVSQKLIALEKCVVPSEDWKYSFKFDKGEYKVLYKMPRKPTREEIIKLYNEHVVGSGYDMKISCLGNIVELRGKQNSYFFVILAHFELLLELENSTL